MPKKDRTWRPCGDYRKPKVAIKPDRYPGHRHQADWEDDLLQNWSVESLLFSLNCWIRHSKVSFRHNARPFWLGLGLRNAAQSFQRFMNDVLQGLDCCVCYNDNIFVASENADQHLLYLRRTLNYYRRFISKVADHQAPLNELLCGSKNIVIVWSTEAEETFQRCRESIAETTLLVHSRPNAPLTFVTNASNAVGSVVEQKVVLSNRSWFERRGYILYMTANSLLYTPVFVISHKFLEVLILRWNH